MYSSPVDHRSLGDRCVLTEHYMMCTSTYTMSKVLCVLSVLQKKCRKLWCARYRPENMVLYKVHKTMVLHYDPLSKKVWMERNKPGKAPQAKSKVNWCAMMVATSSGFAEQLCWFVSMEHLCERVVPRTASDFHHWQHLKRTVHMRLAGCAHWNQRLLLCE
jgi:hypothetical protein